MDEEKNFNPDERFCVKEEFSSALILPEIPPFGEKFDFYEKIQGGSHFFAYTEHFVNRFKQFSGTRQVRALRNHLNGNRIGNMQMLLKHCYLDII